MNKRQCTECWKKMTEWFVIEWGMHYFCSDECLHKNISQEEYADLYNDWEWDSYWTEF